MSLPPTAPGSELWCRGCRRSGVRRLDHAERAWLADLRARHLRRALLGAAIVQAVPLALVILVDLQEPRLDAAAAALYLTAVGLPLSLFLVRAHLAAFRHLGRDLAGGDAWWFEAPAAADTDDTATPPERPPFGVLPHSRRVLDLDDRALGGGRADVIETEPQSGVGWYAPLSLEVSGPEPRPDFRQRALSAAERAELTRVAAALRWPQFDTWLALLSLALLVSVFVASRHEGARPSLAEYLSAGIGLALGLRVLQRYTRAVRLAGSLRQDLAAGLVVHAPHERGPGAEFLPFSRLMWKDAGAPAPWRDRRDAVRRLRASL